MRVLSCNIRYSAAHDGNNAWPLRRALCARVIASREADIVCFQEMSREQYIYLREALPEFDAHGMVDRPDGQSPQNAIFWRRDRFALVSAGGYWLSETPHISGSKSWDSRNIRQAVWARLALRGSGLEVRVVGTHLDHIGQTAREGQARLINEDAAAYAEDYPQILCGDMNATVENPAIQSFLQAGWRDSYTVVHPDEDPGNTFHAFQGPAFAEPVGKIDWIFFRGRLAAVAAEVIRDCVEESGLYPSDHYFLGADILFSN